MMTLDDLIDSLLDLRARYPGAGTAYVLCPVDLEDPFYEQGEVQLGRVFASDDDDDPDDPEPTLVH
jgi:hypothetical protein